MTLLALGVGRVVSVDRIVEELWPGTPPDTATHAVQVYVSQLRKTLGEVVSRQGPGYVLDLAPDAIDVHRFARLAHDGHEELRNGQEAVATETLRSALALWRGPALADFVYEPFAQSEIARLDEMRFAALEDRIEADLALGRHGELATEIEALVEAQPLRERPRALLMRALYLAGRQADALAAYREARDTLVEELGIEPGPELRELESAILRQDESLVPAAGPAIRTRRLAAVLSVGIEEVDAVDLETEDRNLEHLSATVASVASRHGGIAERLADGSAVAVFGVPVVHEDDPLRAARAAVEIGEALVAAGSVAFAAAIDVGEVVSADRSVSGSPVRSSAKLRLEARRGEILVSAAAARRITHAARLEARGEASALVELAEAAPAFERRQDTPFVGRGQELRALRDALKRTRQSGAPHAALVVGPAGVGKSRLVAELTRRSRGVTTLSGRCLSYGDGITYWPLHEMLGAAGPSDERDAVQEALDAETPPQAAEIALLFRRLCETIAREKPLLLVIDDLHWAEPTLLDLVDHVVEKADGPVLAVCIAREELDESHSDFLAACPNLARIDLGSLSDDETEAFVDGLDGAVLDPEQRGRLVEIAEGNPFFLEQLVALALEGGFVERPLPETVQALLSARLDRLGPGERAVLERGAVIGKEFTAADVVALLEPAAAATAGAHLTTLTERGLVEPGADDGYGFRHLLVQEAVYRSAPKRLRAELHERFADRLNTAYADIADLDEFAGYHLAQAYRMRSELGESGRHPESLALEARHRLGEAGVRAAKRGDVPAALSLLRRATSISASLSAEQADLEVELAIMLRAAGRLHDAQQVLTRAAERARATGDRRVEARALLENAYVGLSLTSRTADELLAAAAAAIPVFEATGDDRLAGRAWLLAGWIHGGHRGQHRLRLEAAERALAHYERSTWPVSIAVGEIANALYFGPVPVGEAIARCESLERRETLDRWGRANVEAYLGGLIAQTGDFSRARTLIRSARATYDELGHRDSAAMLSGLILGEVDLLAGDDEAAVEHFGWLCDELTRTQAYSNLASAAAGLAEALLRLGRTDEAHEWTETAELHSTADDLDARVYWMPVRAKLLAGRSSFEEALVLANRAVELAEATDALNRHAKALRDRGEILLLAGRADEARVSFGSALALFDAKGNVVGAERTRSHLEAMSP